MAKPQGVKPGASAYFKRGTATLLRRSENYSERPVKPGEPLYEGDEVRGSGAVSSRFKETELPKGGTMQIPAKRRK